MTGHLQFLQSLIRLNSDSVSLTGLLESSRFSLSIFGNHERQIVNACHDMLSSILLHDYVTKAL